MDSRGRAPAAVIAMMALALRAEAAVTCSGSAGPPGSEVTAEMSILSPADGHVVTDCTEEILVTGTWRVTAPPASYDFYLVIDASGSMNGDSGIDVDGDTVLREEDDDVYSASIAAARAFVEALDPARSRVAIITFSDAATLRQQLTPDFAAVRATLDLLDTQSPSGGTALVPPLQHVESEVLARGDRVNRYQRCIMISDGEAGDGQAALAAAIQDLAVLDVVVDAFDLSPPESPRLASIAEGTSGRLVLLPAPGDIVAMLPLMSFAVERFTALNTATGDVELVAAAADGTFRVTVPLSLAGPDLIRLTLAVGRPDIVEIACEIHVNYVGVRPDAGADFGACAGDLVVLDGSASLSSCPTTLHRWVDCDGNAACPESADPTCEITAGTCEQYLLEAWCEGEACRVVDGMRLDVSLPAIPRPMVEWICARQAYISVDWPPATEKGWDLDSELDSDGDGDPANDADSISGAAQVGDDGRGYCPVVAWTRVGACFTSVPLTVDFSAPTPAPIVTTLPMCNGWAEFMMDCPVGASCAWDVAPTVDADGDGDPANDRDDTSWAVTVSGGAAGYVEVVALAWSFRCESSVSARVDDPPPPIPIDASTSVCPGTQVEVPCNPGGAECYWDLDGLVDSDLDGDPTNDPDAWDCPMLFVPPDGTSEIRLWCMVGDPECYEVVVSGTLTAVDDAVPGEDGDQRVDRIDAVTLRHSWSAAPGAVRHRILRGTIASLASASVYDHLADDATSAGACVVDGTSFLDDDLALPGSFYYLVTALSSCGNEGPTGYGWSDAPFARPARMPTPSCP